MQKLNKFFKNPASASVLLTVLNTLPMAIKFFLLPIYLRILDPSEYGILALIYIITSLYELLGNLRLQSSTDTFYFDFLDDKEKLRKYISNIFSFSVFISITVLILILITGKPLLDLILKSDEIDFWPDVAIALFTSFMTMNMGIYFTYIKNNKEFISFASYNVVKVFLNIGFQLYFLLIMGWGITGIIVGDLIGTSIVFLYFIVKNNFLITTRLNKEFVLPSLKYSAALLPFLVFFWANQRIDRFFLERLLDFAWVGKYAALIAVVNLIRMIARSSMSSFRPFLFRSYKAGVVENKNDILLLERVYIYFLFFIASLIILAGANLEWLLGDTKFIGIVDLIPLATIVPILLSMATLFNQQLVFSKNAKKISGVSIFTFIIVMPLYYYLIPEYKLEGLIIANIIGNGIVASLFYYFGEKHFPVQHDFKAILVMPIAFYSMVFGLVYLSQIGVISYSAAGLIQFLIFTSAIIFFGRKDILGFLSYKP